MAQKWNSKVQFPKDNYVIRCMDDSFGPSKSSGKPMITLGFEIVSPETITVDGSEYTIAGTELKAYYVTQSVDEQGNIDVEKTQNIAARLKKLYEAFGLDFSTFNPENPTLGFKGKSVHALLYGDVQEQRKAPTAEQIAKGQKQGDVLKNPITGKALVSYYPKIDDIFGLASADAGKPYG